VFGPLLALVLVATVGTRWAIGLSVIPGLLAAAAIVYAIRKAPKAEPRPKVPLRIRVRPVWRGDLGRMLGAVAAFEVGNVAATLLILRATDLLSPEHGTKTGTTLALVLYVAYNVAATAVSIPAGRTADRLGSRGPVLVLSVGVAAFAVSYALFAVVGANVLVLAVPFVLAGIGIGVVETAQHSAGRIARPDGSAGLGVRDARHRAVARQLRRLRRRGRPLDRDLSDRRLHLPHRLDASRPGRAAPHRTSIIARARVTSRCTTPSSHLRFCRRGVLLSPRVSTGVR
jgi:hypothetical protein